MIMLFIMMMMKMKMMKIMSEKNDDYNNDYDHDGDMMIMMMVLLGQTCIAPDYIYCHEKVYDKFLLALKNKLNQVGIHIICI